MKKHIVHNFSFYIHKKINIQKTHKMKKKTKYQTYIFLSREGRELLFFILKKWKRTKSERMNLYLTL